MISYVITGGPVTWLLLGLALASLFVYIERLLELRNRQIDWQDFIGGVTNNLDRGNVEEALSICERTVSPVANLLSTAIRNREAPIASLKEMVEAQKRSDISRLARRMSLLTLIGDVAPLLGLFGTLLGFVKAINMMEMQDLVTRVDFMAATMDSLLAAALGLGVWISTIVFAFSLKNRMTRIVNGLDAASTHIVTYFGATK